MESQDNNPQFTGTPQSESVSFKPKGGNGSSKIFPIISVILILGLAAGGVFFFMQAQNSTKKIDDLTTERDAAKTELNAFREATGAQNAADVTSPSIDFGVFYNAISTYNSINAANISENVMLIAAKTSFIKPSKNGKFQIAFFGANEPGGSGWNAYFYRALPDGNWTLSNFSGNGLVTCAEGVPTEDEIAAFEGIVGCFEDKHDGHEH